MTCRSMLTRSTRISWIQFQHLSRLVTVCTKCMHARVTATHPQPVCCGNNPSSPNRRPAANQITHGRFQRTVASVLLNESIFNGGTYSPLFPSALLYTVYGLAVQIIFHIGPTINTAINHSLTCINVTNTSLDYNRRRTPTERVIILSLPQSPRPLPYSSTTEPHLARRPCNPDRSY